MTLPSNDVKSTILKNAKILKSMPNYDNVYISPDLPVLTRKENSRLYKAYKMCQTDEGANVSLRYGHLTVNGTEV